MRRCCVRTLTPTVDLISLSNRPCAERQRRLSWRAPPSDRCKILLFVIPQCDNKTVSIAQEYLDRTPESVLAIAAQRAPPIGVFANNIVSLKDWPDADVAILQVGSIKFYTAHLLL